MEKVVVFTLEKPNNGATLPLLTSCIAASEKFEVNKQTLFGDKPMAETYC